MGSGGTSLCGVPLRGGGERGAGRSNGCGGGWSRTEVLRPSDGFFAVGAARPSLLGNGMVSDSCMMASSFGAFSDSVDAAGVANGLSGSGVGGADIRSRSSRATPSPSSDVRSCWCFPGPSGGACFDRRRPGQSKLALRDTSPTSDDEATETVDSRAALRRWRSASSQRRRFYAPQTE